MGPRKLEQTRSAPAAPPASPEGELSSVGQRAPTGRTRGLVSRPSGPEVTAFLCPPPADLADIVEVFWVGRWCMPGDREHVTELLGDPCMHLAFERCGEFEEARLVGVWTKLWRRSLRRQGFVRAAKLRTGAGTELWSSPASAFTNRITPLDALVGSRALTLCEYVLAPEKDTDGLAALAEWLRRERRPEQSEQARLVQVLMDRVRSNPDLTRAEDLAHAAGLGLRALQQLFRVHVGASPKWLIRRYRLQEVASQLEAHQVVHLAQLAARLGYADQAHLSRDFKSATGKTPREFAAAVHSAE